MFEIPLFGRSNLEANSSKLFPRIHVYIYIYIFYVYICTHLHQDGNAITMVAR